MMGLARLGGTVLAAAGAVSSANAAFVGGHMPIDESASDAASASLGVTATVFNMYIVFDEADDILNSIGNADFNIILPGNTLVQTAQGGASPDTDGDVDPAGFASFPTSEWDSYVGLGGPNLGDSNVVTDPDFEWASNGVRGGWYDREGGGGSRQGVAGDGVDIGGGLWGVWAGRFVVQGEVNGLQRTTTIGNGYILSRLLRGQLDVNWLDAAGGGTNAVNGVSLYGEFPAPGSAGLFVCATASAARRRRSPLRGAGDMSFSAGSSLTIPAKNTTATLLSSE